MFLFSSISNPLLSNSAQLPILWANLLINPVQALCRVGTFTYVLMQSGTEPTPTPPSYPTSSLNTHPKYPFALLSAVNPLRASRWPLLLSSQMWGRGEQHAASGTTSGSAQGVKEEDRSEKHDAARRYSPLHDRAAEDAPGVWGALNVLQVLVCLFYCALYCHLSICYTTTFLMYTLHPHNNRIMLFYHGSLTVVYIPPVRLGENNKTNMNICNINKWLTPTNIESYAWWGRCVLQ